MNTLNNLINTEVNQIQRIANLHVQAFAAKLDALNAITAQDKNILYTALQKVQKNINNTRTMRESLDLTIEPYSHDYTRDVVYKQYQLQKHFMNENQRLFVKECIALSESDIPELKSINEDLKMGAKNKFEKLKELIKSIYEKFLMKMNKLIMGDTKFLKQYKDVILNKKIDNYKLNDMPDYQAGVKNIIDYKLDQHQIDIKNNISLSESAIQNKILPAFNGNGEFVDFAKNYFLCDNTPKKDVDSNTLNMAEIYEFCLNAKPSITNLEKDRDTYISAATKIKQAVLAAAPTPKTESNILGDMYYYSTVLESYINEAGEKAPQQNTSGGNSNPNQTQDNADNSAKSDVKMHLEVPPSDKKAEQNKDLKNKVKSKEIKDDDVDKEAKKQAEENKDADKTKIEESADWYLKALQTVCTAKITAFQKIYSEYMKILRYHVKEATGSLGKASSFTDDEVNNIKAAMKEYKNAKTKEDENKAAQKIIDIYKSRHMTIDDHDVQKLVEKNAAALE